MATRTRVIAMDDGLAHKVEVRTIKRLDDAPVFWTHTWCEPGSFEWTEPAFVRSPATCLRCNIASKPRLEPYRHDDETK